MNIKTIKVGFLKENCYILEKNNYCLIVDPGDEYNIIKKNIKLNPIGVLITHRHFDHIGALDELLNDFNISVYDYKNVEEKEYNIGPFKFEVIYTPGHSKDSICFKFKDENILISGDFIFKDNIGRCDLPGGSIASMNKSIEKIKKYSNFIIYPGHGDFTSLDYEKQNNFYFF